MKFQARQGDLLIESVGSFPVDLVPVKREQDRIILARGEATGHHHAVLEREVEMLKDPGTAEAVDRWLRATASFTVVHEEHAPITVPAGNYVIRRQREYAPERIRMVAD